MDSFLSFVEVLVALGVVVAGVSNYLIINKLWKRKAKQDVAESISISAALLGLVTGIPFFIQFVLIDQSLAPALKQGFGLLTGFVFIGVGSGFWVKANRGAGFIRLFSRALNLERHESADLIKTLIQPKGAQQILTILERLAAIDQHMDEREIELIQEFARKWKIDASELTAGDLDEAGDLLAVRSAVLKYVDMRPPRDQAAQLMDVLQVFVKADAKVTAEEEMALEELTGILEEYVADDPTDRSIFEVLIVPQNDGQVAAIAELIPGVEMTALRGGDVFSVGRFFSASYAEVICQKYIALGLFTTTVTT
jgi:hypothetical protein